MHEVKIGQRLIGLNHPTYFIAEIGANHDGSLDRALMLCTLAKKAGADCAKFQHFKAETIVSDYGFKELGHLGHHSGWTESVFDTFKNAETPLAWIPKLKEHCDNIGIEFMSSPYDQEAVNALDPYVNAYKIGSGEIDNIQFIKYVMARNKPVLLACGASTIEDIQRLPRTPDVLMQCNTNYSGEFDNVERLNLRVISEIDPSYTVAGLSDHTTSFPIVLMAVGLGARVIEKHFTDSRFGKGVDHHFATEPPEFWSMVRQVRFAEMGLGDGQKKVEDNEKVSRVVQRRCLRATKSLLAGTSLGPDDIVALRPAPEGSFAPFETLVGRVLKEAVNAGQHFSQRNIL